MAILDQTSGGMPKVGGYGKECQMMVITLRPVHSESNRLALRKNLLSSSAHDSLCIERKVGVRNYVAEPVSTSDEGQSVSKMHQYAKFKPHV